MLKRLGVLCLVALAMLLGSCVTKSTHTEGDREVNDQTAQAGQLVVSSSERAIAAIEKGNAMVAKSLLQQGAIAGAEIVKNARQQEEVHGAPEKSLPFTPINSEAARSRSTEEHATSPWLTTGIAVATGVGCIAATFACMPWLAQMLPALTGKVGKMAKAGVEIVNGIRSTAQMNGGSIDLVDVLKIAKDKNVSHGIEEFVKRHAHAHEDAVGHRLVSLSALAPVAVTAQVDGSDRQASG